MRKPKIPIIDVKKYGGKQVAIVNGKIIAFGNSTKEVLKKIKLKFPEADWRDVLLISVPKGLTVVYKL